MHCVLGLLNLILKRSRELGCIITPTVREESEAWSSLHNLPKVAWQVKNNSVKQQSSKEHLIYLLTSQVSI